MTSRLRALADEVRALESKLREGGGIERAAREHARGKLTARERVTALTDPHSRFIETGLLVAYDQYDGQAPAAGVVTGVGVVHGREVVIVANDATVKAGSWWPETIRKILRAQEIAMRCRIPIVYLVDSAGVNLPYQGGVFPGQYGASRIFYYNSLMRRYLRIPQFAAVMGQCVAGGAYLPALSDVILMVENTSFMGLGGPNLVKGATGQVVDAESLGGAVTHTELSAVAHYREKDDSTCLARLRSLIERLPEPVRQATRATHAPAADPQTIYDLLPADHRVSYDMHGVLRALLDGGLLDEFQQDHAREILCGDAQIDGIAVGVIANQRGLVKGPPGTPARFGGIIYAESAEKVAFYIDRCDRQGLPLLFVQDVSGFMVGPDAEKDGIIRAGARFVEAMATATVPKLVLTVNHASGAGYYAMAGQGFDPDFIFSWPTGRMGVMEGESAVQAVHGPALDEAKRGGKKAAAEVSAAAEEMRADYEHQLDARYAAARGYVDAIIYPEETRDVLAMALRASLQNKGPHLGAFVLPPHSRGAPMKPVVRVAAGQGFWGDWLEAPRRQVEGGQIDYLMLDYLAEVTMSILQKQKERDPNMGYARDFVGAMESIFDGVAKRGVKVIANAGGVNPVACAAAVRAAAQKAGVSAQIKIGVVTGDDLLPRLDELIAGGHPLKNMEGGQPLATIRDRVLSANAYLGSGPIVEALAKGANVVITGRSTDTALTMAPLRHEFAWAADDWDRLAAGIIAGHIIECGAQSSGGNCLRDWRSIPDLANVGYPIVEGAPDGTFIVTKHPGTGGRVDVPGITEQLVYEMGDPHAYITPDVVADFTSIRLESAGSDRVRVHGIRGRAPTESLKVSIAYKAGFKAVGTLVYAWPDALEKAQLANRVLRERLDRLGLRFDEIRSEFVGASATHGALAGPPPDLPEVTFRIGVRGGDRVMVERFTRELAPLVLNGPPSVTGFAGGRPKVEDVVAYWPALVDKRVVSPRVSVEGA